MTASKLCYRCQIRKPLAEYNKNAVKTDGLQGYCKDCQRTFENSRPRLVYQRRFRNRRRNENRERFHQWLSEHPCIDCGEDNIIVLELDHINPQDKTAAVSNLVHQSIGWERIAAEIKKCVVRCANCHRKKTAQQFNWGKIKRTHPNLQSSTQSE